MAGMIGTIGRGLAAGIAVVSLAASATAENGKQAGAELQDRDGKKVGEATLTETPHGVLLHVDLMDVPPGVHAFHIHETGTCEPPFTSAGGHFNPSAREHGIQNERGMHAGDLPNLNVPANGKLTFEVLARDVTLASGMNSLLDTDGSALVIHATADDYTSDPAGNAGDRLICGAIIPR